jgi:hypothetical protein
MIGMDAIIGSAPRINACFSLDFAVQRVSHCDRRTHLAGHQLLRGPTPVLRLQVAVLEWKAADKIIKELDKQALPLELSAFK